MSQKIKKSKKVRDADVSGWADEEEGCASKAAKRNNYTKARAKPDAKCDIMNPTDKVNSSAEPKKSDQPAKYENVSNVSLCDENSQKM